MIILALQLGHNATVALYKDGAILGAVSQEKFDNVKNSSAFPKDAIEWILKEFCISPNEIDVIANSSSMIFPSMATKYLFRENQQLDRGGFAKELLKSLYAFAQYRFFKFAPKLFIWLDAQRAKKLANAGEAEFKKLLKECGLEYSKVVKVDHHTCHAYSAFYSLCKNKNKKALIFTADGSGDHDSSTVSVYENGEIRQIASSPSMCSLGSIYSNTTRFLGMKVLEHEYKVMGLAPYAKEKYAAKVYEKIYKDVIWLSKDGLSFETSVPTNRFDTYLKKNAVGERFDNIAAAAQMLLEDMVVRWVANAIEKTGINNVYFGGGVFMNVKMNKKIMEMPQVAECHFMPSCGDESNPFGAAFYVAAKHNENTMPFKDVYMGPKFSNDDVKRYIDEQGIESKYTVSYIEDMESKIAEILAGFKIVARFKGRAEWGARSLGNRAILGNPSSLESFFEVNDMIKQRDFWMPFAPSILEECAKDYFINPKNTDAPYMILAFDSTELGRKHLRAATHQADKTLRAQIVKKDTNPEYHALISKFRELTGIGGVMNTSFNLHGYPLVATIEQAIFTFENSGLKFMVIENYLLEKK